MKRTLTEYAEMIEKKSAGLEWILGELVKDAIEEDKPKSKFSNGQIVKTSGKHFSQERFTKLLSPTFSQNRGWVYIEQYIDRQGSGGGAGCWFEEELFEELTDPTDILFAERIRLKTELASLDAATKEAKTNLDKINYSLNIAVPKYETVIEKCRRCNEYFTREDSIIKRGSPACKKCNNSDVIEDLGEP